MIEEPYRWVEAISNRREYIEDQLGTGSPIAALSYDKGILFLTFGRERQKIFEIYDRIAMGAIGHPGDIERLRMSAIEVTSTEGFVRSAQDVSLRRLASYSLSPALKAAFEQVYGAPYLARMLFAELGKVPEQNLFVRLDYDGSMHTNGGMALKAFEHFGVVSGTRHSTMQMERFLGEKATGGMGLEEAIRLGIDAWTVGHMTLGGDVHEDLPDREAVAGHRKEQIGKTVMEAAVLEREARSALAYRPLDKKETDSILAGFA